MADKKVYERMRERDRGLAPWSERAVRAVIEAIFGRAGDGGDGADVRPPPAERVTWVTREIDDFLARASLRTYALVLLSLGVVNVVAPLFVRRLGTLASLSLRDRVLALERLETSGLAPALLAVKALASVHYYEHPDAAAEVGFDGEASIESAEPPQGSSASLPQTAETA